MMLNKLLTYCETLQDPIGIDNRSPRFSWRVEDDRICHPQKSYRITVLAGEVRLWDSQKVADSSSTAIAYNGDPLVSFGRYTYRIEAEMEDGSVYYGGGSFEMGILERAHWKGDFLAYPAYQKRCAPVFATRLTPKAAVKSARTYFCGLGYGELYINGHKTDNSVLDPGWTDYRERALYRTFDVTALLQNGENKLRVLLGDGWMAHNHKYFEISRKPPLPWYHEPCFLLNIRLEYVNGEIETFVPTPEICFCNASEILSQNVFDGEIYSAPRAAELAKQEKGDLRTADGWMPAMPVEMNARLTAQLMPPIGETALLRPKSIVLAENGSYTVDMGVNFAGVLRITVKGSQGSSVKLRHAEVANEDNTINQTNLRYAACTDEYFLLGDGKQESYTPRFTYRGFRFAELTLSGKVQLLEVEGIRLNSAVERIGSFECSSEMLNRIYQMLINTELNNMHSVPTDCPQRDERLGWINDNTLRLEQNFMNLDSQLFYEKWLDDLRDQQRRLNSGAVPDSCPYYYGMAPARWNTTVFVSLPYYIYCYFGDKQPMERHWQSVKWYMAFQETKLTDEGLIDEYYVGEWCPPMKDSILEDRQSGFAKDIKNQLATGCFYYLECRLCQRMAFMLNDLEALDHFQKQAAAVKDAINKRYFNFAGSAYLPECQGNAIFPLFLDIVPEGHRASVEAKLLRYIEEKDSYHISTGSHMTRFLFETLHMMGRDDVAVRMLEQKDYPGFGYMIEQGATALWERWERSLGFMTSHDHPMTGGFGVWFFKALGGIRLELEGEEGLLVIAPSVPEGLDHVNCRRKFRNGQVISNWRRVAHEVHYDIAVPWNTRARIELAVPDADAEKVTVNGRMLSQSALAYHYRDGKLILEANCNYWHIIITLK